MADKRQKKAHKGLIAPHFHRKVRDTEFPDQIKDLGKIREGLKGLRMKAAFGVTMPVSFSGYVQRPKKGRCHGTKADTGLVTVTDRRSL